MAQPKRGEAWLADLGLAAKVRPVLVVSIPYSDADYALVCVIPRTATPHGSQFEVNMQMPGLQPDAFNLQGMLAVPNCQISQEVGKSGHKSNATDRSRSETVARNVSAAPINAPRPLHATDRPTWNPCYAGAGSWRLAYRSAKCAFGQLRPERVGVLHGGAGARVDLHRAPSARNPR